MPIMIQTDWEEYAALLKRIQPAPHLTEPEEHQLVEDWKLRQNTQSLSRILRSHLKLVARIARGYRGYGLPVSDLISEGHVGMMHAMKHYDPNRGFRLTTYAQWWIRAQMQKFVLSNWSLVRIGTTQAQRTLFFSLNRIKHRLGLAHASELSDEQMHAIALEVGVPVKDVQMMQTRRSHPDCSLNAPIHQDEDASEWIQWVEDDRDNPEQVVMKLDEIRKRRDLFLQAQQCLSKKEWKVLQERRLKEPPSTLHAVAQQLHCSGERVRQIEAQAFQKLHKEIQKCLRSSERPSRL
jgi:RNA polymerase sigma-32 factor